MMVVAEVEAVGFLVLLGVERLVSVTIVRLMGMQPLAPEILPQSSSADVLFCSKTHSGGWWVQILQVQN